MMYATIWIYSSLFLISKRKLSWQQKRRRSEIFLDYTPEEFAEELSYNFLTPPEKILKYLKEKTLTYKRFATILMGRSNVAALKKAGYLDGNVHLTSKGFDFVVEAIEDAEKEE